MRNRNPMSEETKRKIRLAMIRIGHRPPSQLGRKRSEDTVAKIRESKLGTSHSEETRKKMSETRKASGNNFYGRTHTEEAKARMSLVKKGKISPNRKPDRTDNDRKHRERQTCEWREWRMMVFTRDEFTCQECGIKSTNLEPHHIIPLRVSFDRIYDITNGVTLCRACHRKTIRKEEKYADKYLALTSSKNGGLLQQTQTR